jgi:phospholipase C
MRSSSKFLLALFFFGAALAPAQTIPPGTFSHIIIVIQENRTPDNLFGAAPALPAQDAALRKFSSPGWTLWIAARQRGWEYSARSRCS